MGLHPGYPSHLALGWQQMSDSAVLDHIEVSQANRFYSWSVRRFPIPRRAIEIESADMHLIPADAGTRRGRRGRRGRRAVVPSCRRAVAPSRRRQKF